MAEPKVLTAAEVAEIRVDVSIQTIRPDLRKCVATLCDSHELLRAENTRLTQERDDALADVERKEHALELALIKNVEVLQIKLRDHYESTPEGFFSALTELRAENKAAREFFEAHGSPEECAKFIDKADALQDENTRLKADGPGSVKGRLNWMGEFAEKRCGHESLSARPFELSIVEHIDRIESENTRLKGLIEGMGHEAGCRFQTEEHCANCKRPKISHSKWLNGHCPDGRGRPLTTSWSALPPHPCNCIQSKVNA